MSDLSFRRDTPEPGPRGGSLVALFLVVLAVVAAGRPWWGPSLPDGVVVEVRGDVPRPGMHHVAPVVGAALRAAGADPALAGERADQPLSMGDRIEVSGGRIAVQPPSRPLLVALPIDLNRASAEAIEAVPGIGASTAASIVADRIARGPFWDLADLARVRGVGDDTVARLQPFVEIPKPPPIDLNRAEADRLQQLPGVGPVIASRIVVDRADRGPFSSIEDLARVPGIGPATVERVRDRVEVRP